MRPVARVGDTHVCSNPHHPPNVIASGGSATADGRPIARVGDKCACGAVIVQGSSQASDEGKPIAYLGCATQCGPYAGTITSGSPNHTVMP